MIEVFLSKEQIDDIIVSYGSIVDDYNDSIASGYEPEDTKEEIEIYKKIVKAVQDATPRVQSVNTSISVAEFEEMRKLGVKLNKTLAKLILNDYKTWCGDALAFLDFDTKADLDKAKVHLGIIKTLTKALILDGDK